MYYVVLNFSIVIRTVGAHCGVDQSPLNMFLFWCWQPFQLSDLIREVLLQDCSCRNALGTCFEKPSLLDLCWYVRPLGVYVALCCVISAHLCTSCGTGQKHNYHDAGITDRNMASRRKDFPSRTFSVRRVFPSLYVCSFFDCCAPHMHMFMQQPVRCTRCTLFNPLTSIPCASEYPTRQLGLCLYHFCNGRASMH